MADPGIGWRILLTAELEGPPDTGALLTRLGDLYTRKRWPGVAELRTDDSLELLRSRLVDGGPPVLLGVAGRTLVISAQHAFVDGLGLLGVLSEVTGRPATTRVRGVAERPVRGGPRRAVARRLAEATLRPPAPVVSPGTVAAGGDAFAETTVPGAWRTAVLVHAAVAGVVAHNAALGRRTRHVAVAVGAGRQDTEDPVGDHSGLLRLTDLEGRSADEVAELLATAPLEPRPGARSAAGAGLLRGGMRLLSRRLGSTLLVSQLGDVTAPGVSALAFHPVTAGGTGLSLGAVTLRGRTTLTLRARAGRWDPAGLRALLGRVVAELPGPAP